MFRLWTPFSCIFRLWTPFLVWLDCERLFRVYMFRLWTSNFRLWTPSFLYVQTVNAFFLVCSDFSGMLRVGMPILVCSNCEHLFSCMFKLWTPFLCMHVLTVNAFFSGMLRLWTHFSCMFRLWTPFSGVFRLWRPFVVVGIFRLWRPFLWYVQTVNVFLLYVPTVNAFFLVYSDCECIFFLYVPTVQGFFVCSNCERLLCVLCSDCESLFSGKFRLWRPFSGMFRLWRLFVVVGMFRLWRPFFWYVQTVNALFLYV